MIYLTRVSNLKDADWLKESTNEYLELIARNPDLHNTRYEESFADFDPFKKRVLEGVTQGLTMASIDHTELMQNNLFDQNKQDIGQNIENYPYQPDLIVGYKGNKVLLDVITSSQTMRDNQKPDGQMLFRHKILKHLNAADNIQTASVPITAVISYDIPNLKLSVNENYDFMADIDSQLPANMSKTLSINFDSLSAFGARFTQDASSYVAALNVDGDKRRVAALFNQLYKVF